MFLDLGNALPTATPGGPPADLGAIMLIQAPPSRQARPLAIGEIAVSTYTDPAWYRRTAGIVAFPADRPLTNAEFDQVENNPLLIALTPAGG